MPASPAQDRLIDSVADGSTRPHRRGDGGRERTLADLGPHYKWIALSNTTLGMLLATINSSIVLIALPDIFKGININPLEAGNTSYLLWMMMGFMVVTAVLVVSFGRLGDMYGRARMYNLGFAVFTISSILLAVTWMDGSMAAWWALVGLAVTTCERCDAAEVCDDWLARAPKQIDSVPPFCPNAGRLRAAKQRG